MRCRNGRGPAALPAEQATKPDTNRQDLSGTCHGAVRIGGVADKSGCRLGTTLRGAERGRSTRFAVGRADTRWTAQDDTTSRAAQAARRVCPEPACGVPPPAPFSCAQPFCRLDPTGLSHGRARGLRGGTTLFICGSLPKGKPARAAHLHATVDNRVTFRAGIFLLIQMLHPAHPNINPWVFRQSI